MYFYKNQGTDVGGTADKATLVNVLVIGRGTLTAKLIVLDSKVGSTKYFIRKRSESYPIDLVQFVSRCPILFPMDLLHTQVVQGI